MTFRRGLLLGLALGSLAVPVGAIVGQIITGRGMFNDGRPLR